MMKRLTLVLLLVAVPLTCVIVLGVLGTHEFSTLPYYNSSGKLDSLTGDAHRVGEFSFFNHKGEDYGSKDLEGKV